MNDEEMADAVLVTKSALRGYDAMADRDDHAKFWFLHPDTARELLARVLGLETVLRDLLDPDECTYDHHGYCQAHGWLQEGVCPQARAKVALRVPFRTSVTQDNRGD